jgi:hypothetical protein
MVKIIKCTNCKGSIRVEGFENGAKDRRQDVTCPHCEHLNEVMWPLGGIYSVAAPPLPKLKALAWHFFFWITPRWLSNKYQVFMMRRIFRRNPAGVERQIRENLRASTGGPSEWEEFVVSSVKNYLTDPKAFLQDYRLKQAALRRARRDEHARNTAG